MYIERLIFLAGLVIGAIVGVGVGVLVGHVELFGYAGGAAGVGIGIVGIFRFHRLNGKKPAAPRAKQVDPRIRSRRSRH